jgi:hypothetical protein
LIYSWKRERVFGACLFETGVVDAHLKFPSGLGDDNRVGQPLRVVDLPYEASVEQLLEFFMDEVLPHNGLLPGLLLHRPDIGVDLQMVLNDPLGILGICDGCRANTTTFFWKKVMSASSYLLPRFLVMWVVWAASTPIWMTFTGTSSSSEGCMHGAEDETR